ncbi:hypothetical protein [Nocardia sp. NPDC020380]|uniref:hypothetical protein n=1 Tax=Nocardia sp. NPDC020380 TaxID=3364309 RepID=UPI0037A1B93D
MTLLTTGARRRTVRTVLASAILAAPLLTGIGVASADAPALTPATPDTSAQFVDWHSWYRWHCEIQHEWWRPRCHPEYWPGQNVPDLGDSGSGGSI